MTIAHRFKVGLDSDKFGLELESLVSNFDIATVLLLKSNFDIFLDVAMVWHLPLFALDPLKNDINLILRCSSIQIVCQVAFLTLRTHMRSASF